MKTMTEPLPETTRAKKEVSAQVAFLAFYAQLDAKYREYRTQGLRSGQSWMCALKAVMPNMYDAITDTPADCFYDDSKIEAFKDFVFGGEHYAS